MHGEDGVVGLHDGAGELPRRVNKGLIDDLLAEVVPHPSDHVRANARAGATPAGIEEEEALQVGAVVALLPERLHDVFRDPEGFRHLSPFEVVALAVLLVAQQRLRLEEVPGPVPELVGRRLLRVHEDGSRNVLPFARPREEGLVVVVVIVDALFAPAVFRDAVLLAEELPDPQSDLATGLADVDVNDLLHHLRALGSPEP
mmetsp:Transcript_10174/g.30179  ORF Transcript_10174/g.30179 Transcript_10174/m.30179 type:complete len:201 (-) Transcript_10174:99-701(-)